MRRTLKKFEVRNVTRTGRRLGRGLGSVHEYIREGVPLAGKVIDEALITTDTEYARNKYLKECTLMSSFRHPNIVQFSGVLFDAASSVPVILMEKLEFSLQQLLHRIPNTTLSLKVSIYADIARGLAYLHGLDIVHRGIIPENILLDRTFTAKITGFRWAKLVEFRSKFLAQFTKYPATSPDYLPPEASDVEYGSPLDIFSIGHLMLYTSIQVCFIKVNGAVYIYI